MVGDLVFETPDDDSPSVPKDAEAPGGDQMAVDPDGETGDSKSVAEETGMCSFLKSRNKRQRI